MIVKTKTGSEYHTSNWRSCMVYVVKNNNQEIPIYQAFNSILNEWELIGNKGNHGKWCTATYDLPFGTELKFIAKSNSSKPIIKFVTLTETLLSESDFEIEGFSYGDRTCGYLLIEKKSQKKSQIINQLELEL